MPTEVNRNKSAAELAEKYVGRKAIVSVLGRAETTRRHPRDNHEYVVPEKAGIQIGVLITDARWSFGNDQVLIQPVQGLGFGATWINVTQVTIVGEFPWESGLQTERRAHAIEEAFGVDDENGTDRHAAG